MNPPYSCAHGLEKFSKVFFKNYILSVVYSHNTYTPTYACTQNHKNNTIRRATQFLEKYTSHFIWKGCVWEGVGDRTELQHIDLPTLLAITVFLSHSPGLLNWRPSSLLGAGFLYHILSPNCFPVHSVI